MGPAGEVVRLTTRASLRCAVVVAVLLVLGGQALAAAPAVPVLTGSTNDANVLSGTTSLAVSGHYAFTTAYYAGRLTTVDIADPLNPQIVGETPSVSSLIGGSNVTIVGNDAYVVSKNRNASTTNNDDGGGNSLTIVDISDPLNPTIVASKQDPTNLFGSYGIAVSGSFAYVASQGVLSGQPSSPDTSTGAFSVVDLTDPTNPTIVGHLDNGSLPAKWSNALQHTTSVALSGHYAIVTAFYGQKVTIIDVADPANPQIVASLSSAAITFPVDVAVQGNYAYVAEQVGGSSNQLVIIDISTPTSPTIKGTLSSAPQLGGAYRIHVRGAFAYISANNVATIAAVDVSDPANPRVAGAVTDSGHLFRTTGLDLDPSGRYVVASSPRLSTETQNTYPPYPLQTGGPVDHGTISVIDLQPVTPSITISAEPPNPTALTSAGFSFAMSDGVMTSPKCSLDGGAFAACTTSTSMQFSSLAQGGHTFTVESTDSSGAVRQASYSWLIGSAPSNSSSPTVSGASTATVGSALTASPGTWSGSPSPTFSYQWMSCSQSGASCSPIAAATDPTYTPTSSDAGTTIEVTVTASNSLGSSSQPSAQTATVTGPPVNTGRPSVSGTAAVGGQLTGSAGSWSGYPVPAFVYQWLRCDTTGSSCQPVAGATSANYTVSSADIDSTLELQVTASNGIGSPQASTSDPTPTVTQAPVSASRPTISGPATAGATLRASSGGWAGSAPISFTYQWSRCSSSCVAIAGAAGPSYVVDRAAMGSRIQVSVTATNAHGHSSATSAPTAPVTAAPLVAVPPAISGPTIQGGTLTVTPGTWSGYPVPTFAYQWKRCHQTGKCVGVGGATGRTYILTSRDIGSKMEVAVTARNSLGSANSTTRPTAGVSGCCSATLIGLAKRSATLRVSAVSASGVKRLVVKLPSGLSFVKSREHLVHSIVLKDGHGRALKFSSRLTGGSLAITLDKPSAPVHLMLRAGGLTVSKSLAESVKRKHRKSVAIVVAVTELPSALIDARLVIPVH